MKKGFLKVIPLCLIVFALSLFAPTIASASTITWDVQAVDSTSAVVGEFSSLAVDRHNHVHISYYDRTLGYLKYAFWDGTEWNIQTVDSVGSSVSDNPGFTSLALDNTGKPNIAYYDAINGDLKIATLRGKNWQIQTIDSIGDVGRYPCLAIDKRTLHITYWDASNQNLKYATWKDKTWTVQTVDENSDRAYSSIAINGMGYPVVSYSGIGESLKLARWNGIAWVTETVEGGGAYAMYTSLALDDADNPHISYCNRGTSPRQIKYASWDGSGWNIQVVDNAAVSIGSNSLALDSHGNPGIAYDGPQGLRYAYWDGTVWNKGYVDTDGGGDYVSLALDADDNIHISFWGNSIWSPGEPALKYAFGLVTN